MTLELMPEDDEEVNYVSIYGNKVPSRRCSKCQGLEAGANCSCSRNMAGAECVGDAQWLKKRSRDHTIKLLTGHHKDIDFFSG